VPAVLVAERWLSRTGKVAAVVPRWLSRTGKVAAVAFGLAILTWQGASVVPTAGLDPSWHAGLNMAAQRGFDFGRDIVWTYGPLGYLKTPLLYYVEPFRVAILYTFLLRAATAIALVWAMRRTFSLPVSLLITWIVLAVLAEDPALVLAGVIAISSLLARQRPLPVWAVVALGAWAGLEALGKLSIGGAVFLILLIWVWAQSERRALTVGIFVASFATTFTVLWLVCSQALGAIPDYLHRGAMVTFGYSSAMGLEVPGQMWTYWAALAIALIGGYGIVTASSALHGRRRGAAIGILALILFVEFKEGFVRHDTHVLLFFSAMLCIIPALGWGRAHRSEALLATVVVGTAFFAALGGDPAAAINPRESASSFWDQAKLTVSAGKRNAAIASARSSMTMQYGFPPRFARLIGNRPVAILPYEAGLAWALRLNWHPLPVFQDYQAYTSGLDDLNANALSSDDGPAFVIRNTAPDIDGRSSTFDPPREYIALLCHFRQVARNNTWEILQRVPNRCGREKPLGSRTSVAWGEGITVPRAPANSMVLASVRGVGVGGFERLRSLAHRPVNRYVRFGNGRQVRIIPALAGDGLLMSAPRGVDYPAPFRVAPNVASIAFLKGAGGQPGGRPLHVQFEAVPVSGSGAAS
jgi:hypothetical protein